MTKEKTSNQDYQISSHVDETFEKLMSFTSIKAGLDFIAEDHENTLAEQKDICAISAPTFQEQTRAADYLERLRKLGLEDVRQDAIGNVLGLIRGSGNGPKLVVAAHLDTVFPEGTDTKVIEREGKFFAPGIADDTRGLAEVLCLVRAFKQSAIEPVGDILFCGNVGEEGLGDLRGTKQLFNDHKDIDGFISIDGTGVDSVIYLATGSHRYKISYKGPGGHSYGEFGKPSAIHAAGRAIARIADLRPPANPKTTFTVGTISGGTSVNTIAAQADLLIDIRSNREEELLQLDSEIIAIIKSAVEAENTHCGSDQMTVEIERLGKRPAGAQSSQEPIVQAAYAAGNVLGLQSKLSNPGSSDANIPISQGIPGIAVGRGGKSGEIHTLKEWFDPEDAYFGPQKTFLTILSLVGVKDLTAPLLKKRV